MAEFPSEAADQQGWARAAALFDWVRAPATVWAPGPGGGRWFVDGRICVAANLVDRHAARDPGRTAVAWQGEPGDERTLSFAVLREEAATLAAGLRQLGLTSADLVALHLGSLPETVVAMMACLRVGARFAVIPTPLPVEGLIDRLEALAPRVLFTQDGAWRHGMVLPLKTRVDDALSAIGGVEQTIVIRRTGMDVSWYEGDRWYHDVVASARSRLAGDADVAGQDAGQDAGHLVADADHATSWEPHRDLVAFPADHPVLVAALPRRLEQPPTAVLGAGAVVAAAAMHRGGFAAGEVSWCVGAMAWPGTIIHGVLGPLALGHTIVLAEGTVDVPARTRVWDLMGRHKVTTLLAAPTVLHQLRAWAPGLAPLPPCGQLRRVITLGEQIDPELRAWVGERLAGHPVSTCDGWGQVELGGVVRVDQAVEPGLVPDPGLAIVDEHGEPVRDGEVGEAVLTRPWAGSMLDDGGPEPLNWRRFPNWYASGDLCRRVPDGRIEFLGRIDHVVSVSGQLVSLGEVRLLLLDHPFTEAVDVIERVRAGGSRYIAAAVVLNAATVAQRSLESVYDELNRSVREILGGLACPNVIIVVDRCGDELRGDERRRALARVAIPEHDAVVRVTWADVVHTFQELTGDGPEAANS